MTSTGSPTATGLPVEDVAGAVVEGLRTHGAAVLVAPPGAGKTTLVPLWLMADPLLGAGKVVVLEPRRLAARAAARRMAQILGEPVGRRVGYRTRDERVGGRDVRVEVVTEGILVRRLQSEPTLEGTSVVVLDEVHERNLVTDLSLALLDDVRRSLRPDLAVLAMSATVDSQRVASVLGVDGVAPTLRSDGRLHPVEAVWWPAGPRDRELDHVARSVVRVLQSQPVGDVLVFLPGAGEIARVASALAGAVPPDVDVYPLHGSLPVVAQDHALAPSRPGRRRVVLATDIAESSLTVEGVQIVVDAGLARSPRYDPASGLTRLVTRPASQASADQRMGRAGRLGPGVAVRLWPEAEHHARPRFSEPEIAVVDLAGLALELAVWGSDPADLAFPDQPPPRAWAEAQALLRQLQVLRADGRPTVNGRAAAGLPLHPRLARMVVSAHEGGQATMAALLAALLDERDVIGGRRHERSADLAERASMVAAGGGGRSGSDPGIKLLRRRAKEIARRVGAATDLVEGSIDPSALGPVVALAYPDRIAQARGGGRFRMRDGGGGWLPDTDPLASEEFLAVADLDVADRVDHRSGVDGRIRLAAALDRADVESLLAGQIETVTVTTWDRDRNDLRARHETRAGAIVLSSREGPAEPGDATATALLHQVEVTRGAVLRWSDASTSLRQRVAMLRSHDDGWPDLGDDALFTESALLRWLAPYLLGAVGRSDLEGIDLHTVLRASLDHRQQRDLDRLLPRSLVLTSGRTLRIDYDGAAPSVSTRLQDLYGTKVHPTVADGRIPIVVHLLSPAGRPVQVTSDLPGFWTGSWSEVRKEMAGRYPKHDWPIDAADATPGGTSRRRRK